MAELPEMTQTSNKIPNIPAVEPIQPMQSYGSPTLPTPNIQDGNLNSNSDQILTAKIPSLQSNMFKMQRNKSKDKSNCSSSMGMNCNSILLIPFIALKKSYVDVFNPQGAAPKNDTPILAPMMPMALQTQPSFFVPAAVPNTNQQNVSDFNSSHYFSSLFNCKNITYIYMYYYLKIIKI